MGKFLSLFHGLGKSADEFDNSSAPIILVGVGVAALTVFLMFRNFGGNKKA